MSALQTDRDRVLESLLKAGVGGELATGIVDTLAEAGYTRLARISERPASRSVSLPEAQTPFPVLQDSTVPGFFRFAPVSRILPTLLLTYDQRIDQEDLNRDMYRYARLGNDRTPTSVLVLSQSARIA